MRGVVSDACLDAAAAESRRIGACPVQILIAGGWVPARVVYKRLAEVCGVPFVDGWPEIEPLVDAAAALSAGRIRLRDAARTRLVAPQGDALSELVDQDAAAHWGPTAVTTPAHLMALVHRRTQASVAYFAGSALPDLMPSRSARCIGTLPWRAAIALVAILMLAAPLDAPRAAGDVLGLLFCAGMVFRLLVGAAAYTRAAPEPLPLADVDLPTYSVLVPLRQEGDVVPDLLAALDALDYPRAKLEVLLLVEPEDLDTRAALAAAWLPPWLQVLIGPIGGALRTKPRALNIGLAAASGSLVTIYDAEDRPAPDQLRRAAAWFHADPGLACLQARLSIRAGGDPLSRLFAIEYAGLFGLLNRGLAALGLPIPLGGTSNHLRTSVVRDVGGWDAWNVAEDADLGLRLGHLGYRVACFDSVTEESAPHSLAVWMRQRRRWTKGWIQTCLVFGRDLPSIIVGFGAWRATSVALLMLGLIVSPLLSPAFGVLVLRHLVRDGLPTPHDAFELAEATLAASVLLMGIATPLWFGWAGLRVAGQTRLMSTLPLLPLYQLLVAVAAWGGLYDLLRRPFHWHKTPHRPEAVITSKLHGLGLPTPIAARSMWGRRDRSFDRQRPRLRRRGQAASASPPRSGWPPASA